MKKLKKIIIKYFFCGTEEEYEEGKPIFTEEAKIYTKRVELYYTYKSIYDNTANNLDFPRFVPQFY
jgi:hypothetical protein